MNKSNIKFWNKFGVGKYPSLPELHEEMARRACKNLPELWRAWGMEREADMLQREEFEFILDELEDELEKKFIRRMKKIKPREEYGAGRKGRWWWR